MGIAASYHGWLVGVPINNPASVTAWATSAIGGGIWSAGGVASDGTNPFVTTGNTSNLRIWSGGEAVIRFQPGPIFSGNSSDYWVPVNWSSLDQSDRRLRSCGPVTGGRAGRNALPSRRRKWAKMNTRIYLIAITLVVSRAPIAEARVAFSYIYGGPAAYRTNQGTYVAFRAGADALRDFPHYCNQSTCHRQTDGV